VFLLGVHRRSAIYPRYTIDPMKKMTLGLCVGLALICSCTYAQAVQWYRKAAEQEDSAALVKLKGMLSLYDRVRH